MKFMHKIAALMIFAVIQFPCAGNAAEEDRELALIAAEQEKSGEEELDDINPALTESISTERTQETDKEIKERKKKLKQMRKEKERDNERKLKESNNRKSTQRRDEQTVIIDPEPQPVKPEPIAPEQPIPEPIKPEPVPEPVKPEIIEPPIVETIIPEVPITPTPQPSTPPISTPQQPQPTETVLMPDQKAIYANFAEVARTVKFTPLYMPRKSGYEITAIYAQPGIVEVRYGRRWEPSVSLAVRTHRRMDGEELRDISGVTGVKWRVDTTTGTTLYIAKISDTQQVAAWAVGHYTFSAQAENLSFAGFHSLVADELVELSTHYYLDL